MDIFVWSTIVLGIWGAVGPLVGVKWGQDLAKQWQKQHWMSDNAKQECRELLSTMADTFSVYAKYYGKKGTPMAMHSTSQNEQLENAQKASLEIFYSRLFISDELLKRKIRDRWVGTMHEYSNDRDADKFANNFGLLVREVRAIAEKVIE